MVDILICILLIFLIGIIYNFGKLIVNHYYAINYYSDLICFNIYSIIKFIFYKLKQFLYLLKTLLSKRYKKIELIKKKELLILHNELELSLSN